MEKPFFSIIILISFLLICVVSSTDIDVKVLEILNGRVSAFLLNKTSESGVVKIKLEFNNIGSLPFKSRVRMEISDNGKDLYTLWSDEKEFNPSEKKVFEVFSFINKTGLFELRTRVYYGGEALDYENRSFEVEYNKVSEDIFKINRVRASKDFIKFDIKSGEDVNNVLIVFSDYPKSWIVEQKKIESLKKNNAIPVKIKYTPVSWEGEEIIVHIFTEDGNFYNTEQIILKEETNVQKIINYIFDFFKRIL